MHRPQPHKYSEICQTGLLQLNTVSDWYPDTHLPEYSENDSGIFEALQENGLKAHWFLAINHQNPSPRL